MIRTEDRCSPLSNSPGHCCLRPLANQSGRRSGLTRSRWSPSPWRSWCWVTWSVRIQTKLHGKFFSEDMDAHVCLIFESRGQEPIDCFLSLALLIRELMSLIALQWVCVCVCGKMCNLDWLGTSTCILAFFASLTSFFRASLAASFSFSAGSSTSLFFRFFAAFPFFDFLLGFLLSDFPSA